MLQKEGPALYLRTDGGSMVQVILSDANGREECLPKRTPAEELVAVMDRDYSAFSREVTRLREEHPLFEGCELVYWEDFRDFVTKVQALISVLAEIDYAAAFVSGYRLNAVLQIPDDQSASFLLESAALILRNLEEPILSQARLRNILKLPLTTTSGGPSVTALKQWSRPGPDSWTAFSRYAACRMKAETSPSEAGGSTLRLTCMSCI